MSSVQTVEDCMWDIKKTTLFFFYFEKCGEGFVDFLGETWTNGNFKC